MGTIDAKTTGGTLTALTNIADTATALAGDATYVTGAALTKVTSTTSAAADLNTIDGKTSSAVNAAAVTTVTGTAAAATTAYNSAGITGLGNEAVTLSDTTLAVADLNTLDGKTSGVIDATTVTTVTGAAAALATAYNSAGVSNLGNEAITLTDTTIAVADLNTLDGKTSGVIDAAAVTTVTGAIAAMVTAYNSAGISNLGDEALTLDDTTAAIADLNTLDGKTSGAINAATVTTLTGSTAAATTAYNSAGITGLANEAVTIDDTTVALAALNTLDGKTSGVINATTVTTLTGSIADATTAYNSSGISNLGNEAITLDDTTATAAALNTLDGKTSGTIGAATVLTITGTGAEILSVIAGGITTAANYDATVTDTISVADANSIDADTAGIVTATITEDSAASLAVLTSVEGENAFTIVIAAGSADAADVSDVTDSTSVPVDGSKITDLTGTSAGIVSVYADLGFGLITGLGDETITVSTGTTTANVQTLLAATSGIANVSLTNGQTGTFKFQSSDTINIDPGNTAATLTPTVGAVDTNGEWEFAAGVFTWQDGATVRSITLHDEGNVALASVEVDGDTITVPAAALNVTGTTTLTISGGIGDITLDKVSTNYVFNQGTDNISKAAAGVTTIIIPAGRALGTTSTVLTGDNITTLTGNVELTDTGTLAAATLNTLDTATSGTLTATAFSAITGTAAAVKAAGAAASITLNAMYNATLSGIAAGADITAIDADNGAGTIDGSAITQINGTASEVNTGLGDLDTTTTTFDSTITGTALADHLLAIDAATSGTLTLGGITTLTVTSSKNISTLNSGAAFAETLDATAVAVINTTMTVAQHNGFTTAINANAGDDAITLTDAGTLTADIDIGTYSVVEGSIVTVGSLSQVITETGTNGTVSNFTVSSGTHTGVWTGIDPVDVVKVVNGTNFAPNSGLNGGVTIDFQNGNNVMLTINATQNGVVTYINTANAQTIMVSTADTFTAAAGIETYGIVGTSNITVLAATNVNGEAATNQTITIGGLTVTGTYALGTGTDVLVATTGADITAVNTGLATTAESLTLTGGITMTQAQHAGFTLFAAEGGTDSITIVTSGVLTAGSGIETYNVSSIASNDVTVLAGTSVTGSANFATTVSVGAVTATGTYALGNAADILNATTGADIKGVNSGAATTAESLTLAGAITMTQAQHAAFTTLNAGGGSDKITVSSAGAVTTNAAIETYEVTEGSTVTVGTAAGNLAQVITETGSVGTVSTFVLGNGVYTGVWTGIDSIDVIKLVQGSGTNVAANTGLNGGAVIDYQDASQPLTLNATQNGLVTFTNTAGTQVVNVTAADAFTAAAGIETYGIVGASNITVLAATNVNGDTGNNVVTVGGLTATGTYALSSGTDEIIVTTGANIAGVNSGAVTTAETLTLNGDSVVTMTVAQHNGFSTITAGESADQITLTTAGTLSTDEDIETYSVVSASTVTVGANAGHLAQVVTETGTDVSTFVLGAGAYTGDWTGIEGDDVLQFVNGTDVSGNSGFDAGMVVDFQNANIVDLTLSFAQHGAVSTFLNLANNQSITIADGDYTGIIYGEMDMEAYFLGDDTGNNSYYFIVDDATPGQNVGAQSTSDQVTFDIGGMTYTGTMTGDGTAYDSLFMTNGANIAGATLIQIGYLIVDDNATVTMTASQNNAFTAGVNAGGPNESITITTAGAVTALNTIERYNLSSGGANNISVNSSMHDVDVNGAAGNVTTVTVGGLTVAGDYALGNAADVIVAATGVDIKGVNAGAATTAESLTLTGTAIMTAAQHTGFTTITAVGVTDQITLSAAGTITTSAAIETYSVPATSAVTVGTAAGHLAQVLTETGSGVTNFTLGAGTYTGVWTSIETDDVVKVANGTNIAGSTGLNGGVVIDFQNAAGTLTLNATQNGVVTYSNTTGNQVINVTAADTFTAAAGIETYGIVGASSITVLAATSVNGDTGNQTVTIGGLTATGTYALDAGTDVIVATNGSSIAGVNGGADTTAETLDLTGGISMTRDQHEAFTTFTAGGASDSVTITTSGSINAEVAIESYSLSSGGANSINVSGSKADVDITGAAGNATTVNFANITVTGDWSLGNAADVIIATSGANITGVNSGAATTAENLTLTGAITMTRLQHAGLTAITATGGSDKITVSTAGAVTTNAAIETYEVVEASTVTVGTAAGNLAQVITETGAVGTVSTFILGNGVYTGDWTGLDTDDVVQFASGANVSGNSGLDSGVTFDFEGSTKTLTISGAQQANAGFTNADTGTQTVNVTTASTFTAGEGVDIYGIVGASNITLASTDTSVNGEDATNQTVTIGTMEVTGTYALGTGTDVIVAGSGADITGVNSGGVTTAESLTLTGNITMTQAQHAGFTSGITAVGVGDRINLTTAGAVTTDEDVETYEVLEGSTATIGTNAGNLAQVIIEAGVVGTVSTIVLGAGVYTGDWTLIDANDVVKVVNGTNISGNTGLNGGVVIDFQNGNNVAITLNATQNGVVTFSNTTNAQTVNVDAVDTFTADADIETYGITGASVITVQAATNVNGDGGDQTVNVGGNEATGTYALLGGTDVIKAGDGADISGVNSGAVTTAETLELDTGEISLSQAQHQAFATITSGETNTLNVIGAGAVTAAASIEAYNVSSGGSNNVTVNGGNTSVDVVGNGANATTVTVAGLTVTGDYALNHASDVIVATTGANISGVNGGAVTTAESLTLTGAITMTRAQHAALSITAGGVTDQVTFTDVSTNGTTGKAAVETYVLANVASNDFTLGASAQNVTGSAGNADTVRTGAITNVTGNLALGGTGTDVLIISTTATNISAATTSTVEQIDLDSNVNATMTTTQHDLISAGTGTNTVTIINASASIAANAVIENYILGGGVGADNTITLSTDSQSVTTAAHAANDTVNTGTRTTINGSFVGNATATDILLISTDATNISTASGLTAAGNWNQINLANDVDATMTALQNALVTTATGDNTITISAAATFTAAAGVETYKISGASNITVLAATNVTGEAGTNQTVTLGGLTATGTYALGGTDTDVLVATNGASIAGVNSGAATTAEVLNFTGAISMTAAQYSAFTTIDGQGGSDTIDLTTVLAGAAVLNASVEYFMLAASATNSVTTGADGQSINATALTAGQALTLAGANQVYVTMNAGNLSAGTATGAITVTAGSAANTIATGSGADTVTGGAGSDIIDIGSGADTVVFNSLTGSDNITGYGEATDSISLLGATFSAVGASVGAAEFEAGSGLSDSVTDGVFLVYDTATGNLYYDADDNGAGTAVLIATFVGIPTLAATEFTVI